MIKKSHNPSEQISPWKDIFTVLSGLLDRAAFLGYPSILPANLTCVSAHRGLCIMTLNSFDFLRLSAGVSGNAGGVTCLKIDG